MWGKKREKDTVELTNVKRQSEMTGTSGFRSDEVDAGMILSVKKSLTEAPATRKLRPPSPRDSTPTSPDQQYSLNYSFQRSLLSIVYYPVFSEFGRHRSHATSYHAMPKHDPNVEIVMRTININAPQTTHFLKNSISTCKYNLLTFLPKFLFEQFRRYANIFFLFISLMQQIPDVSPTGRYTTSMPLLFILWLSAIKEIIEDMKRRKADGRVNNRDVFVLKNSEWVSTKWTQVAVGDIVKVTDHHFFPCDLIILSSSEPQGMCYIETANLDGETNLKIRQGLQETLCLTDREKLGQLKGYITCEAPNRHLYNFIGNIFINNTLKPLGPNQVLLRGAMLRNTKWIYGIAVYSGHDTKLMLNSTSAPLKRSTVEKVINKQMIMLLILLFVISFVSALANMLWANRGRVEGHWYLGLQNESIDGKSFAYNILTFIILYNNLIPISLQVTLEMVKFIQAQFINWDLEMYHEETNTPATARTSNLNEELGQIKYIFSDKTGTLTCNNMVLKECSIYGKHYQYTIINDEVVPEAIFSPEECGFDTTENVKEFLRVMAICHTVVPQYNSTHDTITFQASSPDEIALVTGARFCGYNFHTRTPESIVINEEGEDQEYQILDVIEFTSTRKCMSVIIKNPNGVIQIVVKGSDSVLCEKLYTKRTAIYHNTMDHLNEMAKQGLRTLCYGVADITETQYLSWSKKYRQACTELVNREENIASVANEIESNLKLIGATAIEDKLQDGVPEAICSLLQAGIKIWVLTGDKQETAINIGFSTKLLTPEMELVIMNTRSLDTTREFLKDKLKRLQNQQTSDSTAEDTQMTSLVIDGQTLEYAMSYDCQRDFVALSVTCKTVICCRVSPLQKAQLVELIRSSQKAITLAIGDGANDVGMIQAAHVGVGISGVEGLQAACASDYAIGQFRFLTRLLLVHGSWNYSRLTKLILFSFYKNICLIVIEFWFAIYSGFSGQIVFERWCIGMYNVIFSAYPPIVIGLFDRHSTKENLLLFPRLYKSSQNSELFNVKIFWFWCVNAVFHSAILFYLPKWALEHDIAFKDGKIGDYLFLGNMVYTYVVVVVSLKAGLETHAWTIFIHMAMWGGIGSWFLFLTVYSHVFPWLNMGSVMVGMDKQVFGCWIFWLLLIVVPTAALFKDFISKIIERTMFKSLREQIHELDRLGYDMKRLSEVQEPDTIEPYSCVTPLTNRLSETARLIASAFSFSKTSTSEGDEPQPTVERHGFAFSQEEHGAVNQAELIRIYDTRSTTVES